MVEGSVEASHAGTGKVPAFTRAPFRQSRFATSAVVGEGCHAAVAKEGGGMLLLLWNAAQAGKEAPSFPRGSRCILEVICHPCRVRSQGGLETLVLSAKSFPREHLSLQTSLLSKRKEAA